jgi:putative membrane protein
MRKTTIAAIAVAAATALPATAAATTTSHSHSGSPSSSSTSTSTSSKMLNAQDKKYLKDSAQGALFEILGGKTALTHASRTYVRIFGQRMIIDHSRQYRDAREVAEDLDVSVPKSPEETQQRILELLSQFRGASFDCAYLSAEWNDHKADIAETKLEIATGRNQKVKAYARKYLPVLEEHLKMAEQDLMKTHYCGNGDDD